VHAPVLNRHGEIITSTVDSFDFFDACRLSNTYDIFQVVIVNPEPAQRALAERLIAHGSAPERASEERGRFDRARWAPDLASAREWFADAVGTPPLTVATSARRDPETLSFAEVRGRLEGGRPVLLVIGKAWGLAPPAFDACDARLEPIDAGTGYNHLSVRSAMAILTDRLLAPARSV
jgi:tRNA (guanine37-N1)-methyltransferase